VGKKCTKTELNVLWHSTGFLADLSVFFLVSSVCPLVRVTMEKNKVNWGSCGIPWVNCAVFCVKDDCKRHFWGLRYCLSKLRSLLSFSVRCDVTQ